MRHATIEYEEVDGGVVVYLVGDWSVGVLSKSLYAIKKHLGQRAFDSVVVDASRLKRIDIVGATALLKYLQATKSISYKHFDEDAWQILQLTKQHYSKAKPKERSFLDWKFFQFFAVAGKNLVASFKSFFFFLDFLGLATTIFLESLLYPKRFRFKNMLFFIQKSGADALIIVALTSFLIGVVIAYQGAFMLSKFGADIFVVDMSAISIFRELGPLITAIVIAGRSASAFSAEIGVMKLTEEIDAMKSMGFDAYEFLVIPRILALMITVPLLVIFADTVAILGSALVAKGALDINYEVFFTRLFSVLMDKHIWIGIIKGVLFGWLIALIGTFRGFQVSLNTESIGRYTTKSVVNAISWVIVMDAVISVILTRLAI